MENSDVLWRLQKFSLLATVTVT